MAKTAEDYAKWIVANKDKRGTPQFETVAQAYKAAQQRAPMGQQQAAEGPKSGPVANVLGGVVEPALQLASAAVVTPVAGLAGAVAAPFVGGERASEIVQGIQRAGTYQPRTEGGQAVAGIVAKPFEWLAEKAKDAGNVTMDLTKSPELATGVETAVNMLPAILLKGVRSAKGAKPGKPVPTPAAIEQAARAAATAAGLHWERLPGRVRLQIMNVARDSKSLESLPPQALERQARMAGHPAPITPTRGQATRDPVQMGLEKEIAQTDSGRAVRSRMNEQTDALNQNLEIIRDRTGAREATAEGAGGVIQGAARAKLAEQKAGVSKLYAEAERSGEMNAPVSAKPVQDFLNAQVDLTNLKFAQEFVKNAGPTPIVAALERLRSRAVEIARTDKSTAGHDAGNLVGAIDKALEGAAAGPKLQAARAARKAMGGEFERQGAVKGLVTQERGMTDRAIALEDTFNKTVLGGSIQDLRNAQRTFMAGQKGTRKEGRRAMKELAGQTIDYIKAEANRGVATMENGRPSFSAPGFVNAVEKKVGRAKLELLFGKSAADELFRLVQSSKDLLTEPPAKIAGSPTFKNILRWLDRHGSRVPVVGPMVSGSAKLAGEAYRAGRAGVDAEAALRTPLAEAVELSRKTPVGHRLADLTGRAAELGDRYAIPLTSAEVNRR